MTRQPTRLYWHGCGPCPRSPASVGSAVKTAGGRTTGSSRSSGVTSRVGAARCGWAAARRARSSGFDWASAAADVSNAASLHGRPGQWFSAERCDPPGHVRVDGRPALGPRVRAIGLTLMPRQALRRKHSVLWRLCSLKGAPAQHTGWRQWGGAAVTTLESLGQT